MESILKLFKWKSRAVSYEEGKKLADEFNLKFFEASAKTGENVENVIKCILEFIK